MSYPPPPGASNSSSLPPRPPPSKVSGFKPAFSPATHSPSAGPGSAYTPPAYSSAPSYSTAPGYSTAPSYSNAPNYPGAPAPTAQYGVGDRGVAYPSYGQQGMMGQGGAGYQQSYGQQQGYQQQPSYYGAQADPSAYSAAPQIRNPFPAPSPAQGVAATPDYDPEMAAQIAQWQSAYGKDPKDNTAVPGRPGAGGATTGAYSAEPSKLPDAVTQPGDKKKTVVRAGGGQKWTDDTLLEWDPSHLRLFVGNLAGETTDESLYKAFSRWKSLQKARVIRDKVTSKSKGFGFVSFSDPDEFFSAAKEMNGKYIQSHPVVVRKSTTEIKPQTVKDKHHNNKWNKNKNKNKNKSRGGNGSGTGGDTGEGSFEPALGPHGGGVTKPGQKTKGGLKLLG
ncbi:uncharacterized protein BCR38DRAFT_429851 [Pseudomassariella vexata]|uniref:RRM domain-containing protein n=1 Tax=Pseudomassariella vexata TaxID=1141098 RepID=A0A1Y2E4T9_9PEZI|nr:uncharacterized protein BCR38DRAFT_429851 [Pseudomassariella vexata]ORY66306.1 hypothetical protein BCR38DRAFT_429851 [Pseudomassariella vexata]